MEKINTDPETSISSALLSLNPKVENCLCFFHHINLRETTFKLLKYL